ncbi:hypothetical protein S245_037931 [Arachis hypogaea]|nr:uncharacterized protein DS421_11g343250 [Arachis hypogaea]
MTSFYDKLKKRFDKTMLLYEFVQSHFLLLVFFIFICLWFPTSHQVMKVEIILGHLPTQQIAVDEKEISITDDVLLVNFLQYVVKVPCTELVLIFRNLFCKIGLFV